MERGRGEPGGGAGTPGGHDDAVSETIGSLTEAEAAAAMAAVEEGQGQSGSGGGVTPLEEGELAGLFGKRLGHGCTPHEDDARCA